MSIPEIREQKQRVSKLRRDILNEILSTYEPCSVDDVADYEITSHDLAEKISKTISIGSDDVAIELVSRGFHTKMRGGLFLWQMKIK